MDLHDYVFLTNPDLRTLESVQTKTEEFDRARAGGVTTALLISGSGTNMSGLGTAIKFVDGEVKDAVLKFPASIKIAQAGNPERYWFGVGRSFMNYNLRNTLKEAKAYDDSWKAFESGATQDKPWFSPTYDAFRQLFNEKFIASVHTQAYQVVMSTITMVDGEYGVKTVLDHSTFDGYKTAPLVNEAGDIITINGPRQFYYDGTQRRIFGNASRWFIGGVPKLGINTDSPVIPQEELTYQAAMACWYGLPRYAALKGLTRVGAEALMLDDRIGSLQKGKDADFAIWSGDPVDPRSVCWITVINGKIERDVRDKMKRF
jgi:imidazolonepropionase-like amidohydrolase